MGRVPQRDVEGSQGCFLDICKTDQSLTVSTGLEPNLECMQIDSADGAQES